MFYLNKCIALTFYTYRIPLYKCIIISLTSSCTVFLGLIHIYITKKNVVYVFHTFSPVTVTSLKWIPPKVELPGRRAYALVRPSLCFARTLQKAITRSNLTGSICLFVLLFPTSSWSLPDHLNCVINEKCLIV